jgi:ATP-dependent RNA helicase DbpA
MHSTLFSTLPLAPEILKNLETLGYKQMTPVQAKSLPTILQNQDVIVKAMTGSGKTAAFGLGIIAKIKVSHYAPQAIVICPTRELADQVSQAIRRLARFTPNIRVLTLCGGKPVRTQTESLRNGAHIIVGTPGRLQDHIDKNTLVLGAVKTLVLDEADRMLDMGFYDDIMTIIKKLPPTKQTMLFSATYPRAITKLSQSFQNHPINITLDAEEGELDIEQMAYAVQEHDKAQTLTTLLKQYNGQSAILFCTTKIQCKEVVEALCEQGFHALALHGDLEQREREEVLLQFANHSCTLLVATDVAARGLDICNLPLVINYDLPSSADVYVHRIGRTGRGGQSGQAISLYTSAEAFRLDMIEGYTQSPIQRRERSTLSSHKAPIIKPAMRTICINAGKKNKIRPGDILGAFTGEGGLKGEEVGKINIYDFYSYVAISRALSSNVLNILQSGKIKGHAFKMRFLDRP